jgi:dihydropteroate synthase
MHPDFERLAALLKTRPLVMGILNVTPDSFSDGGRFLDPRAALEQARRMQDEGADIVDLGGESTRPGAPSVSAQEEMARVLPVARGLAQAAPGLAWSIDTQKASVAQACLAEGACLLNDVSALQADPGMLAVAVASQAGVSLMHRLQAPQNAPWSTEEVSRYGPEGVTAVVKAFLQRQAAGCQAAGIAAGRLWLDPGLGFGKTVSDNLKLLKELPQLAALGLPVLVGPSRKSFVGAVLGGLPVEERLEGTLAACTAAVMGGASVLRVHDVLAAKRAVALAHAIKTA